MQHIDLEKFANGAFSAQVNRAIEEVTITIGFKPNQERNFVTTGVQAKTTLAPALGTVTAMSMGRDIKTGNVEAVEVGNQIPGQMSVQDLQTNSVGVVDGQAVDTETGEILGDAQQDGKVIDLRTKQA